MVSSGSESFFNLNDNVEVPIEALEPLNLEDFFANVWNNPDELFAGPSAALAPQSPVSSTASSMPLVAPLPASSAPAPAPGVAIFDGVGAFIPLPPPPENPAPLADERDWDAEIQYHLNNFDLHGLPDPIALPVVHQQITLEEFLQRSGLQFAGGHAVAAEAEAYAAAAIAVANGDASPPQSPQHSEVSYQAPQVSDLGESTLMLLENIFGVGGFNEQQPPIPPVMSGNLVGNGYAIGSPLSQGGFGSEGENSAATLVYGLAAGGVRLRGRDSGKRQMEDDADSAAARSRAKKQAYTMEIEAELASLRKELLREKLLGSMAGQAKDIGKKAAGSSPQRCNSSPWINSNAKRTFPAIWLLTMTSKKRMSRGFLFIRGATRGIMEAVEDTGECGVRKMMRWLIARQSVRRDCSKCLQRSRPYLMARVLLLVLRYYRGGRRSQS